MVRKSYTPEQIINKLREAEIMLSPGSYPHRKLEEDRGK